MPPKNTTPKPRLGQGLIQWKEPRADYVEGDSIIGRYWVRVGKSAGGPLDSMGNHEGLLKTLERGMGACESAVYYRTSGGKLGAKKMLGVIAAAKGHAVRQGGVVGFLPYPAAKPVHPSLEVLKCICEHTKSRHRGAWGEPHAGACKDCVCEVFELEVKKATAIPAPAFVWKKEWSKKAHPAADLLPMMSPSQQRELAEDIKRRGQIHPIVLFEGRILDGRNRLEACRIAEIEPRFVRFEDESGYLEPVAEGYVRSANAHRRHLTKSQLAVFAAKLVPLFKRDALERQRQAGRDTAAKRRGDTVPARAPGASATQKAAEAANQLGAGDVGERLARRAAAVGKADKKLYKKIWSGDLTIPQAERQIRMRDRVEQVKAYVPPEGKYPVIVVDPAWKYEDKLEGVERELPYPTMSIFEIKALQIPAADDCVLWLWVTNAHMRQAFEVLDAWGFEPKTILTWAKDKIGLGRWLRGQTEHCILATRGSPTVTLSAQSTILSAPRLSNSEKPPEFFALVESLCPAGPKLEMFAREHRQGWVTSGSELPATPADFDALGKEMAGTQKKERKLTPIQKKPGYEPVGKEQRS